MKRLLVLAVLGLALTAAAASAQVPPPTLTGEQFLGGLFAPGVSSVTVTSENCNPSGTSTFTYVATGPAGPPYVGTYTETGTVEIGPQIFGGPPPNGVVTSWTATFSIDSVVGTVEGNKSLTPPPPGATSTVAGICTSGFFPEQRSAATGPFNPVQHLAYTAVITTPEGAQFADHGQSFASVNVFPEIPAFNNFFENFFSEQTETTPLCNQNDQSNQNQVGNDQGCVNP